MENPSKAKVRVHLAVTILVFSSIAFVVLGPRVGTSLRDVDAIAVDFYSRYSFSDIWTMGHLRGERVHFFRPLSDSFDAGMIKVFGYYPAAFHFCLILLIIVNATLLARWINNLCRGAGWLAGTLYVVHPFQQGTVSYFEGGSAHVTYLFFALLFFHAMGSLRKAPSLGRLFVSIVCLLGATLCFDGALGLPFGWFILDRLGIAPYGCTGTKRLPWKFAAILPLVVVPVLLLRKAMIGVFLGGYGAPIEISQLGSLALGYLAVVDRIFFPAYPILRDMAPLPVASSLFVWIPVLGFGVVGLIKGGRAYRVAFVGMAALFLGLLLPTTPDFALNVIDPNVGDLPPNGSYRLSVPMALMASWIAISLRGGVGRIPYGRFFAFGFGILIIIQYGCIAKPLGESCDYAGQVAERVRAGVVEQFQKEEVPPEAILVFGTPLDVRLGAISTMRVFQYGLPSALRPPMTSQEIPPTFPVHAGSTVMSDDTRAVFANHPKVLSLFSNSEGDVSRLHLERLNLSPKPATVFGLLGLKDGDRVSLSHSLDYGVGEGSLNYGFELCWSLDVMIDSAGLMNTNVSPVVVILNGVTPFYFNRSFGDDFHLPIRIDGDRVCCWIGGPYIREIQNHFPDRPVFLVVEGRDVRDRTRVLFRTEALSLWLDETSK